MLHQGPSKQVGLPVEKHIGHEEFIQGIRGLVCQHRPIDDEAKAKVNSCKLTYGPGERHTRGITYYQAWGCRDGSKVDLVGISANNEESIVQLTGTTIHELGHVLAGRTAGHGVAWKEACRLLGLTDAKADGQCYIPEHFDSDLWERVKALGDPQDGNPLLSKVDGGIPFVGLPTGQAKPCPLGIGTRGGTSRGKGSGSRMRLYHCACAEPIKIRHAGDDLLVRCEHCKSLFYKVEK